MNKIINQLYDIVFKKLDYYPQDNWKWDWEPEPKEDEIMPFLLTDNGYDVKRNPFSIFSFTSKNGKITIRLFGEIPDIPMIYYEKGNDKKFILISSDNEIAMQLVKDNAHLSWTYHDEGIFKYVEN